MTKMLDILGYGVSKRGVQKAYCHYCWTEYRQSHPWPVFYMTWANANLEVPCVLVDGEWCCAKCITKLSKEMSEL